MSNLSLEDILIAVNPSELRECIDAHVLACLADENFEPMEDEEFIELLALAGRRGAKR